MLKGTSYTQFLLNAMNEKELLSQELPHRVVWFDDSDEMYRTFMKSSKKENVVLFFSHFLFKENLKSKGNFKLISTQMDRYVKVKCIMLII